MMNIYICQLMAGVRRRGRNTSLIPYHSYRYKYSDSGKFIPIQRELYNTPRLSIVANYNMEPTEIG